MRSSAGTTAKPHEPHRQSRICGRAATDLPRPDDLPSPDARVDEHDIFGAVAGDLGDSVETVSRVYAHWRRSRSKPAVGDTGATDQRVGRTPRQWSATEDPRAVRSGALDRMAFRSEVDHPAPNAMRRPSRGPVADSRGAAPDQRPGSAR